MHELRGRIAVVTGAARGIGLAVSEAFIAEGMQVVLADRNDETLGAAVDDTYEVTERLTAIIDARREVVG